MLAPGTAAPVESSTLPETDAVTCALIVPAKQMQKQMPTKACVSDLLSDSILHPPAFFGNFGRLYSPQHIHIQIRDCPDFYQYVIKPAAQAEADLGHFLFTRQWYVDPNHPFHRSPSVMTYDRANNRIALRDARVWIAGLGDDGGSGSWLAAAMKKFGQPNKDEIAKFEQFIDGRLWGNLQYSEGPRQYGVKKSLFYYDPAAQPDFRYDSRLNWGTWTSWNKASSEAVNRAYNYPHVMASPIAY